MFDWSHVTADQLRRVPRDVVGCYFEIDTQNARFLLKYQGIIIAELWPLNVEWLFVDSRGELYVRRESIIRRTIACIDRIANYLAIHGARNGAIAKESVDHLYSRGRRG